MRSAAGAWRPAFGRMHRLWPLVLVVVLLRGPISAAHASIGACRSDPVFLLSNGAELELSAAVDTDSSNVLNVSYTLFIPTGVQVVAASGFALGSAERWSVVANMPPGQYQTDTFVQTSVDGVAVRAATQAVGLIGATLQTVNGYNDQHLEVQVTL